MVVGLGLGSGPAGCSAGRQHANPGLALVLPLARKFEILGSQRPPSAPAIHDGPLIVIAVGDVAVNSGLNVFEYRKRGRFLRLCIWSSVFHVMLV